ncbi:hypothetical protein [Faecalimonas umbilicata]|uniref:hypothetical protein n=1 Tax=Faecalimonas umbilicata TaxID=1912855 RepID=UPI000E76A771|nr:hypothetical protein [Faecalimonas umbilicata]RJV28039.1 hypothetical protein DWX22_06100 [Coprococcus sp. AF18-48]
MGDFGDAERGILAFMTEETEFVFQNKKYKVILSGKPTCHKGEPKTDIYILAESEYDKVEIKISYKKENADFIENKMSAERAKQLFGINWELIIEQSTTAIRDKFEERMLIYKNKFKRTEKGAITLGWKFELLNKNSGELSGKMLLTEEQVIEVYAGSNLSEDKRNAMVCGQVIENSGIANYILMDEDVHSAQDVIDKMIPITEYVKLHPNIYFACKALNYRTFAGKWDGDRPLSVQVFWNAEKNKLVPKLVYDKPLMIKGNEVAGRLLQYMKLLNIKTTDDIDDDNAGTDRII